MMLRPGIQLVCNPFESQTTAIIFLCCRNIKINDNGTITEYRDVADKR